jgi:prophage antirepressor-like protein
MSNLQVFNNSEFGAVRVLEINQEPWFIGKDVAEVLGYVKPLNALATHIDEDDSLKRGLTDSMGRIQETILINESGLYSLILSSKLENAKRFKRWVTAEVLPAIRKHGLYAIDDILNNPDIAIAALTKLKEEREARKALETENKIQAQQIAELQPKATYYDLILQSKDLLSVTQISKDYGMSATKMNRILHELGVQFNQSGVWFLYAKYQTGGYTQTKTHNYAKPDGTQGTAVHMYWTQKGRLFLYSLLKNNGILPLIERC